MTTQICLGLFRAQLPAPPLPNPCGGAIYFGLVVTQGGPLVSQSLEWLLEIAACFCLTHQRRSYARMARHCDLSQSSPTVAADYKGLGSSPRGDGPPQLCLAPPLPQSPWRGFFFALAVTQGRPWVSPASEGAVLKSAV
jgi:hypothetical protein